MIKFLLLSFSFIYSLNSFGLCINKKFHMDVKCNCVKSNKCLSLNNKNYKNYLQRRSKKNKKIAKYYNKYHHKSLEYVDLFFKGDLKFSAKKLNDINKDTDRLMMANRKIEKRLYQKYSKKYGKKINLKQRNTKIIKKLQKKYIKLDAYKVNFKSYLKKVGLDNPFHSSLAGTSNNEILKPISIILEKNNESLPILSDTTIYINNSDKVVSSGIMKKSFSVNTINSKEKNLFHIISSRYKERFNLFRTGYVSSSTIKLSNDRIKRDFKSLIERMKSQ